MSLTESDMPEQDDRLREVLAAYLEAFDNGWAPARGEFLTRYPALRPQLEAFFAAQDQVHTLVDALLGDTSAGRRRDLDRTVGFEDGSADPLEGVRSFGDYEILEEVARGGMGVVYKARQKSLNRTVALKMILTGQLASASDVQRFRHEAEAAALMDHPGIVPMYEVGEHNGRPFFSMKLVEGGSLAKKIPELQNNSRGAARVVAGVARAVHYAHQRGILHRDLKPGNILLGESGEPLVTDFGLAKRFEGDPALTQSGAIVGTPSYMAPEQASGETRTLTTAADVHALGAILYELLAGRPPFQAGNVLDTLLKVREEKPLPPRSLNPRLDADVETICLKCLEKEPQKRYGSAELLADDLERWLRGEPVRARRVGVVERTWKWARRRPGLATLLGVLTTVLTTSVLLTIGYLGAAAELRRTELHRALAEERLVREESERARAETSQKQATAARDQAERARQEVLNAYRQAEMTLYVNRILRAHHEWQDNDVARADQLLDECPQHLRHWEWHYLKRLCHSDLLTLKGFPSRVHAVCFSPDGTRLATASLDQTVKIWDAQSGQEVLTLKGHANAVSSVCFSPDGTRLATGSWDQTVKVWDAQSGQEVLTLKGHANAVSSVCFSPDSKRLASATSFGTLPPRPGEVKVWDIIKGQQLLTLKGHTNVVSSVCFSPDGKRLASASGDETVKVWDADKGQEVLTLKGHTNVVSSVCFSPDGTRLASASADRTVKVWDAQKGHEVLTLKGHTDGVSSVCFNPDGTRLASASDDRTVKVWEALKGQQLHTLKGHTGTIDSLCFSPDGKRLASASWDQTIKVWDAERGQGPLTLQGHTDKIASVCFSPDGKRLASASWDQSVKVWNAESREEIHTLKGHTHWVLSVAFSPDGKRLASAGSDDQTVKVWDAQSGHELLTLKAQAGTVESVCFSPDGTRLASAGSDHTVKVWDAQSGQELRTLKGHTREVTSACFSPDGTRLASASGDQRVRLWDPEKGQELRILKGHTGPVWCVCFSPDGKRLASASHDQTVKVWDAETGQEVLTLKGHTHIIDNVCFSPDGKRLASGSWDQTIKVWDAAK
jgi:WD40 repeat protein/tRNA A-37 threonylcarbamoyl transferase component Bud32